MSAPLDPIVLGRVRLAHAENRLLPAVVAAMGHYLAVARAAVLEHDTSRITIAAGGDPRPEELPPNLDAWPPRAVWARAVTANITPAGQRLWRDTWDTQLAPDEHAILPEESDEFGEYLTDTTTRLTDATWPDEVYDQLRQLVVTSVTAGDPASMFRGKVAELLDLDRWSSRARFIGRNESQQALNSATHAAGLARADLFGEQLFKRWLAVPDVSTREAHRRADGQVVAANQPFEVGGERLRYPHDPRASAANSANCRCLVLWIDRDEARAAGLQIAAEPPLLAAVPTASIPRKGSTTMGDDATLIDTGIDDLAADVWSIPSDEEIAAWNLADDEHQYLPAEQPAPVAGGGVVTAADFTPSGGPTAAKRKRATKGGNALPGGRFPVENGSDLDKAINAVGRAKGGEAGRRLVRRYIMRQARKLGLASRIPATWNSDGTLKPSGSTSKPMAAAAYADPAPRLSFVEQVADTVPMEPDPDAFAIPPGPRGTKLHVVNDAGWVAGYLWDWDSRHRVYDIPPPRDPYGGGYPKFRRHPVRTADGGRVMSGPITTNGHGDPAEHTMASVIAHYDDPRFVAANVVVTEAEHGGWACGSLRAGVSPFQVALLDTYSQSGHWMHDELVASCCVSVPAFELPTAAAPVAALAAAAGDRGGRVEEVRPHAIYDDDGHRVHLIAAGMVLPGHETRQVTASVDAWQLMRDLRAAEADDQTVQAAKRRMMTDPGVTAAATRMRKGA